MGMKLKYAEIFITTRCTLHCRLCANGMSYARKQEHFPLADIFRDIDMMFELCDSVERLQPMGGEPLFHPEIVPLMRKILEYRWRIGSVRIASNATIVPSKDLIDLIVENNRHKRCEIGFLLSNYGKLSTKFEQVKNVVESNGIPLRVDNYTGDNQYFGGWCDTGLTTISKPHSPEKTGEIYSRCEEGHHGFRHFFKGKVFPCCMATAAEVSGLIPPMHEAVDIYGPGTIEAKQERILAYDKEEPFSVCAYCNGFGSKFEHVPGGEQS
jgi:hypothetical protein